MGPEGALRVGLLVADGRIERVRISSTRPDVARSLLQGRTPAEVGVAVPLLFAICGRSQAAASTLALAAAVGVVPSADTLVRSSAAVSAETVRELSWRALLDWPRDIGEHPTDDAVAAARSSFGVRMDSLGDPGATAIALATFGMPADEWLALLSVAELDRWADAGATASARFIRRLRDDDDDAAMAPGQPSEPVVPLLDASHDAAWIAELCEAADAQPGFARQPTWRGAAAETGALARWQGEALISDLLRRSDSRVTARFVSRLRELALLLAGRNAAAVGALRLPGGGGVGWVENARGLLVHQALLAQERVDTYRIVAPTEWNFHPAGALAVALTGAAAGERQVMTARAARVAQSLDPCVACRIEFDDA